MSENKKSENLETKPHLPPELSPKGALDPIVLIEKTPPHEVTRLTSPIREATEELPKAPSKTNETPISSRRRQKSAKSPTKEESPDMSLEKEHDINVTASKSKTKLKKVDEPSLLLPIQSQVEHTTSQISDNLSVVEEVEKTTSRRGRKKISEIASSLKERAKTSKTEPQDEKLCPNVIEVSIIPKKRGRKKAVENIEQIVTPDDKISDKTDKTSDKTDKTSDQTEIHEEPPKIEPQKNKDSKIEASPLLEVKDTNELVEKEEKVVRRRGRKKVLEIAQEGNQEEASKVTDVESIESIKEKPDEPVQPQVMSEVVEGLKEESGDIKQTKTVEVIEKVDMSPKKERKTKQTKTNQNKDLKNVAESLNSNIQQNPQTSKGHDNDVKDILDSVKGRKRKIAKKIKKFLKDVDKLIEIQESQSRTRNRSLLDSKKAVRVLKKYRKKRRKTFSVVNGNNTEMKLKITREHRKPYHVIEKNIKNPLKLKLLKKPANVIEPEENVEQFENCSINQPEHNQTTTSEINEVPVNFGITPKKRGRPSKKDSPKDEITTVDEIGHKLEKEQPSKSPSPKRRMLSPTNTEKSNKVKDEVINIDQAIKPPEATEIDALPGIKRRGRPPKKAIIAELEAEKAMLANISILPNAFDVSEAEKQSDIPQVN